MMIEDCHILILGSLCRILPALCGCLHPHHHPSSVSEEFLLTGNNALHRDSVYKFLLFSSHLKSPHSAKRPATSVSRLPQPIRTPQRPAGLILSDLSNSGLKTPSSIQKKAGGLKSAYAAVASPVASYVRNNPAPHLVQ